MIENGRLHAVIQTLQQGKRLDQIAIPLSIKESILSRTIDLDPTTTEVLHYAAVIGRRFDFALLLWLTGHEAAALVRSIETLIARQLVIEEPSEDRYSFRHALTREAIYDDLLRRERRMRHREVLRALEALSQSSHEDWVEQLLGTIRLGVPSIAPDPEDRDAANRLNREFP